MSFIVVGADVSALALGDTVFAEACRNLDILTDGPALDQDFLNIIEASVDKVDFYRRMSADVRFRKLNSNFTLMTRSASSDRKNTTAESPRVIGFGGSMVLASVDHPAPPDPKQASFVEGIAYASRAVSLAHENLAARQLHFFTVDFSTYPARLDLQPQTCYRCHAGRFNWETYNVWPGALSSKKNYVESEEIHPLAPSDIRARLEHMLSPENRQDYFYDEAEALLQAGLDNLLPKMAAPGRKDPLVVPLFRALYYQDLHYNDLTATWSERRQVTRNLQGIYATLNFKSFEGNRELNEFMNSLVFDKLAAELKALPSFAGKRYAALASVMDCGEGPDFLSPEMNQVLGGPVRYAALRLDTENQINKQYQSKAQVLKKYGQVETLNLSDLSDLRRLTSLRYLFENDGFDLGSYSPNFFGRTQGKSYGFAHVGAGTFGANQLMCYLAPDLVTENIQLAKFFSDAKEIDSYRSPSEGREVCEMLKILSRASSN